MVVYGENLGALGDQIASVTNFLAVPLLQTNPSLLWRQQMTKFGSSVNLFPSRRVLSSV